MNAGEDFTARHCIVVGVDESGPARKALAWAVRYAQIDRNEVVAVHAWEPVTIGWTPYPSDLVHNLESEKALVLRQTVDKVLHDVGDDVAVETHMVRGPTARTLVHMSEGATLLVIGRPGHHDWTSWLGSAGGYCARHASCPVVVVPA